MKEFQRFLYSAAVGINEATECLRTCAAAALILFSAWYY